MEAFDDCFYDSSTTTVKSRSKIPSINHHVSKGGIWAKVRVLLKERKKAVVATQWEVVGPINNLPVVVSRASLCLLTKDSLLLPFLPSFLRVVKKSLFSGFGSSSGPYRNCCHQLKLVVMHFRASCFMMAEAAESSRNLLESLTSILGEERKGQKTRQQLYGYMVFSSLF